MAKIILITGCSKTSGIGYNAAELLAKEGNIVIATVRNKELAVKLNSSAMHNLFFRYLDLTEQASMEGVITELREKYGRIDTLINNAGYGLIGAVEQLSLEQIRKALDTNITGVTILIKLVLPLMKKNKSGHIINVSSIHSTRYCQPSRSYYRGSKAFLETISEAISIELIKWNIHVTLFEPGRLTTSITKEFGNQDVENNHYTKLYQRSMQWFQQNTPVPQTGSDVAIYLSKLVNMANPPFHYESGEIAHSYTKMWRGHGKSNTEFEKLKSFYNEISHEDDFQLPKAKL